MTITMCQADGCKNRAAVEVDGELICYEHYNAALKQGAKGRKVKGNRELDNDLGK